MLWLSGFLRVIGAALATALVVAGCGGRVATGANSSELDGLLREARALQYRDLQAEMARAAEPGMTTAPEKYERALALYEEALRRAPDNVEALAGAAACREMLTPYIPVQRLEPLAPPLEVGEVASSPTTPWEVRRAMRDGDRAGMAFTGEAFSADRERFERDAAAVVDAARAAVNRGEITPEAAMADASGRLRALQEAAHQSWKGHGPTFLDASLRALADALGQISPVPQPPTQ